MATWSSSASTCKPRCGGRSGAERLGCTVTIRAMDAARLIELRLDSFKSFKGAVLPLGGTTVLTGRNSSGKSNALDALEVFARLAEGDDLVDALDSRRRERGAVRGGSVGCAPHGSDRFAIGCTVETDDGRYDYDLGVEVVPDLRIVSERLYGPVVALDSGRKSDGLLYETRAPGAPGTGIEAELHNGKRGSNPPHVFRDSRLILGQLPLSVGGGNRAERSLLLGARAVLLALRGVFHLDPVPHLMRDFAPRRDVELRRTGENVSAALQNLSRSDRGAFERLSRLVGEIADDRVEGIEFLSSDLDEVMLALNERRGPGAGALERTPAREMSDGLLRFIAVATTLLSSQQGLDVDAAAAKVPDNGDESLELSGAVLVVLEELENGLHPSQAQRVLDLVRSSSESPTRAALFTTHSPALLNAAEGALNDRIIVCFRDVESGRSRLAPLTELPSYAAALARGSIGAAITGGQLVDDSSSTQDFSEFERLLGLG